MRFIIIILAIICLISSNPICSMQIISDEELDEMTPKDRKNAKKYGCPKKGCKEIGFRDWHDYAKHLLRVHKKEAPDNPFRRKGGRKKLKNYDGVGESDEQIHVKEEPAQEDAKAKAEDLVDEEIQMAARSQKEEQTPQDSKACAEEPMKYVRQTRQRTNQVIINKATARQLGSNPYYAAMVNHNKRLQLEMNMLATASNMLLLNQAKAFSQGKSAALPQFPTLTAQQMSQVFQNADINVSGPMPSLAQATSNFLKKFPGLIAPANGQSSSSSSSSSSSNSQSSMPTQSAPMPGLPFQFNVSSSYASSSSSSSSNNCMPSVAAFPEPVQAPRVAPIPESRPNSPLLYASLQSSSHRNFSGSLSGNNSSSSSSSSFGPIKAFKKKSKHNADESIDPMFADLEDIEDCQMNEE